ncbi:latent-transforming growth factor beta-binding protein 1 isoform X2 [Oryzias latipes]|uniref:latent-transforming growth factor beta-binding protein 1 isoform X2 n=1 Tax=Oryzias latipes TaxID=8090 RepID=UPI0009D95460|nr:latent-transforming growth factor beta-binding protein 1 isoform X2 [Oryzias latipes]
MRLPLLCVWAGWMLMVSGDAQREDGGAPAARESRRSGWRRESSRGAGDPDGGSRRTAGGPHVPGPPCCIRWSLSTQTRKCIKARCPPPCRNGTSCRQPNTWWCRPGFHGNRCRLSAAARSPTRATPTRTGTTPGSQVKRLLTRATEEDTGSDPVRSGSSGAAALGRKEKRGRVLKKLGSPEETQTSSGGPGLTREGPSSEKASLHPKVEERRSGPKRLEQKLSPGPNGGRVLTAGRRRWEEKKRREVKQKPSLREVQWMLQRKTSGPGGPGGGMATLLMKHIAKEKRRLHSLTSSNSSRKTFSQRGQESISTPTGGGRGRDRIRVMFTPTICKVRCSQDRCVNHCERGNATTVYSSSSGEGGAGVRDGSHGPGFRVFLCPLLCKNGGVCIQQDRCLCPANFTGKFCHIPVTPEAHFTAGRTSSINEIIKPALLSAATTNQDLTHSEFLLPLGQNQEAQRPGVPASSMVKVRVQHPPEASVKVHQVVKVSGSGPTQRALSSFSSGSAGAPAPSPDLSTAPPSTGSSGVQAQTVRGGGTYTQHSGFKYCFREVRDGQCSSPLPGLRSRDVCCSGMGKAWGLTDCVLCPKNAGQSNSSCPAGFGRVNGTQCVAHSVISEEKGQCYRVLDQGRGPSSCSLPIARNITKQICCCSRVGKAWGADCQRCPHFGSVSFKEICPAGPGYHYSASTLQVTQRVSEHLDPTGTESGSSSSRTSISQQKPSSSGTTSSSFSSFGARPSPPHLEIRPRPEPRPTAGSPRQPASGGAIVLQGKPAVQQTQPGSSVSQLAQARPQSPSGGTQGSQPSFRSQPSQFPSGGDLFPPAVLPKNPANPTARPARVQPLKGVCETRPGVCGRGHCLDLPGGKHSCLCESGYEHGPQRTTCQDVDECLQNPCSNSRCENTPGSYRCVCRHGYRLSGNTCTDVDECVDPLRCPGQECVNTLGSYRCTSCQPGYGLLNGLCTDIDECRQSPCSNARCENTPGSYRCVCRPGYRLQNDTCADMDECAEPSRCNGQMCVNSAGSYRCVSCRSGYKLTNRQCTDVDECESAAACEADRRCVNTAGSFRCECLPGYQASSLGRQCRDINECLEGDFCFSGGECLNTPGSYMCVCSQGFTLSSNGTACKDVDECLKPGVCSDGRCVNTDGSFHCRCANGFASNPERTACLDVDECISSNGSVCGSQRCENTIGSYRCLTSCEAGYRVQPDGSCADEDECASQPGVCGTARCENLKGGFVCRCDITGQVFEATSRRCVSAAPRLTETGRGTQILSSAFSSAFHVRMVELAPPLLAPTPPPVSAPTPLPEARPGELRECYYNLANRGSCSLLAANTTQQECCCTVGEGWGLGCQYYTCPPANTAEFLALCLSGRGYVTAGPGVFNYRDVDECKRFQPQVCKNGVCVNNIPGYRCYCYSGYVYNSTLLECVDHDECEEETCVGGVCVNTVGSYYCTCPTHLVLDETQRNCVNSSHSSMDENLSVCWQHVSADLLCQSPLLGGQVTFTDCCCMYGEGWGMGCALCPSSDSEEYAALCSSFAPPFPDSYPEPPGPETRLLLESGRGAPPYGSDLYTRTLVPSRDFSRPDYDDYSPAGGVRSGFGGRTPGTSSLPEDAYRPSDYSSYYSEGDYSSPDSSAPQTPSFRLPPDPRSEIGFGARPFPPSRPDGPPLSLAPLPGSPYDDQEEEDEMTWRPSPPFPPFTDRNRGGGGAGGRGAPRRLYERRYELYAGLSAAEDCGILHGCENGRCIRVAEGYTCDCYHGYELDMTSMTCIDVNECEDGVGLEFPCVNARCVNTEGSFRCVCRRGYVVSRRRNHCVAA